MPIFNGNARWGTLEVSFAEETASGIAAYLAHPAVQFFGFVASAGFFVYLLFMRKTLELLDPSGIVPDRVRAAFDALSEGILLMDARERVVLANNVFMAKTGHDQQSMRMVKPSSLPWRLREGEADYPWVTTLRLGKPRSQILMELPEPGGEDLRFMVNTTPITNGKGKVRGVLASFDDVTPLHEVNAHLRTLVQELEASRQEIARKNDELLRLATRDPLTGCFNRRAFFEAMEAMFLDARKSGQELCCIMTDVDHFKSFNDRYGHAVGDQVIQVVARSLAAGLRNNDLLCRYGGEEFCIILPDVDITQAQAIAERIRAEIETTSGTAIRTTQDIRVTSSFGVSSLAFGATEPTELIEQADAALYASKQAGRNRVSRYDRPDDSAETANAPRFATTH
ncbi:MAG: diguanylate cyclase [Chromatiales bacterium]